MSDQLKKKPLCRYGDKCYRKNPEHLRDFDHSKKVGKFLKKKFKSHPFFLPYQQETAVRSSTPDGDDSHSDEPKSKVAKVSPKHDHIDKPDEDLLDFEGIPEFFNRID